MNLYETRELLAFLSAATLADPFLSLCSAVAWLDPLAAQESSLMDEDVYGGDAWTDTGVAWEISRNCFPDAYAAITLALRCETDARRIATQACTAINQHLAGCELGDLEEIQFGLPFAGRGIDLSDPAFFAAPPYAHLPEVYALLGVEFDPASDLPENFHESAQIADVLAYSLRQTGGEIHGKIAWLLDWLFGQTGNSVADLTSEDVCEMGIQPLAWELNDLEFNNLMHAEAEEIINDAMRGLDLLMADDALQAELRTNHKTIARKMRKGKPHDRYRQPDAERLSRGVRWTERPQQPDEQRAADGAQSVQVRRADAA